MNVNGIRNRIVVVGRNYGNILSMTRALGEAGYEVDVLRLIKKQPNKFNLLAKMEPDAHSKYVKNFYKCIVNDQWCTVIEKLTDMADDVKKTLLIPVDDYTACIIDDAYSKLSNYYILPSIEGKEREITRLMDKNTQKNMAIKYNLPMLKSVLIKSHNGEFEIPDETPYPCFVKPNVSMSSTKAKMVRCKDKEELKKVLLRYSQSEDIEMLIEEYADIKAEYAVLGISIPDQTIAPCVFKVIAGGHRERKGVTLIGEAVDSEKYKPIIEKCCDYIKGIKYTGLFDVDLLETSDGNIYFIELNFRAGASMHLFTKTGINLPGMFADYYVKGRAIEKIDSSHNAGKRFVSEKILLEEYVRNDISLHEAKRILKDSDVRFIKDDKDKKPFSYFQKYYVVAFMMKIPYWIKDKQYLKGRKRDV